MCKHDDHAAARMEEVPLPDVRGNMKNLTESGTRNTYIIPPSRDSREVRDAFTQLPTATGCVGGRASPWEKASASARRSAIRCPSCGYKNSFWTDWLDGFDNPAGTLGRSSTWTA